MPLGDNDTHFDLDSWAGWIWPYRTHVASPRPIPLNVTVRNPYPMAAELTVRLVGPAGWQGSSRTVAAGPRAEVSCDLTITPPGECRRQAVAVELSSGDARFGQVAEALVTVGGERF
jgi:hypothetical protein